MWSSDLDHATCDYPDYAGAVEVDFAAAGGRLELMFEGQCSKLFVTAIAD